MYTCIYVYIIYVVTYAYSILYYITPDVVYVIYIYTSIYSYMYVCIYIYIYIYIYGRRSRGSGRVRKEKQAVAQDRAAWAKRIDCLHAMIREAKTFDREAS